ncbi:MAG: hypothetical protein HY901_34120, partial [Deltaproteobacteria bacterium]|nr:hypothetical protein [Deltaproteobacteria bacterium]
CELLFSLPLAMAAALLVTRQDRRAASQLLMALAAGALCAAATLIKPTAVSLFGAALLWLGVARPLVLGRAAIARGLALGAVLVAGFAGTWGLAALYFRSLGVWDDLLFWAFEWTTLTYVPTGFSSFGWLQRFATAYGLWYAGCAALLFLAARAVVLAARRRADPTGVISLLALWSLAAFAGTLLGGRFYDHYFPALVAPLAALAGIGAASTDLGWGRWPGRLVAAGTALPAAFCFVAGMNFEAANALFGDTRLPYEEVAGYVKARTRASDRVFVWGYYPLIYVGADRLAATRFVGCHYLTGYAAVGLARHLPPHEEDKLGVPKGFETLLHELEEHRAELIVDTAPANLHHWQRYPLERYPLLAEYVHSRYVREAEVGGNIIYRRKPAP